MHTKIKDIPRLEVPCSQAPQKSAHGVYSQVNKKCEACVTWKDQATWKEGQSLNKDL